jgi:hypothetical protein
VEQFVAACKGQGARSDPARYPAIRCQELRHMSKFCLVDWMATPWEVVPWMTFATLDELLDARRTAHPSWPWRVACIATESCGRHLAMGRYHDCYTRIGPVVPFYDIDMGNLPEGWHLETNCQETKTVPA